MRVALVVDPACPFVSINAALVAVGFRRDASVRPVTPDVVAGETDSRHGRETARRESPTRSIRSSPFA